MKSWISVFIVKNDMICSTGPVGSCLSVVNMKFDNPRASLLGNCIRIAEPSRYNLNNLLKEIETPLSIDMAPSLILDSFSQS